MNTTPSNMIAANIGEEPISYHQLHAHIDQTMQWLTLQLTKNEQRIAVALRDPYWHWVCTLALLQLGKSCATVYAAGDLPPEVASSFQVWLLDCPMPVPTRAITLQTNTITTAPNQTPVAASAGLQLILPPSAQRFFLSSGTTGRSKMVVLSANDVLLRLQCSAHQYKDELTKDARVITLMGINTIAAFFLNLLTWVKGGSVIFPKVLNEQGKQHLALAQCNVLLAAPGQIKEILQKTQGAITGREQRIVRTGGSRLHPLLREAALERLGSRVQTTYGMTEVGVVATCNAQYLDEHPGAAGWVLPHAQVQVVDTQHQPVPSGTPGWIRCKAPGMATAYEGTERSSQFREDWFYPGDMGILSANGFLVITGRDSDVINLGGFKMSAVDIESQLLNFAGIEDVCVVSIDYQDAYLLVVAAVCDSELNLEQFHVYIKQVIKKPLPFYFIRVSDLQRNSMGKLPRQILEKKLAAVINERQAIY